MPLGNTQRIMPREKRVRENNNEMLFREALIKGRLTTPRSKTRESFPHRLRFPSYRPYLLLATYFLKARAACRNVSRLSATRRYLRLRSRKHKTWSAIS